MDRDIAKQLLLEKLPDCRIVVPIILQENMQ